MNNFFENFLLLKRGKFTTLNKRFALYHYNRQEIVFTFLALEYSNSYTLPCSMYSVAKLMREALKLVFLRRYLITRL